MQKSQKLYFEFSVKPSLHLHYYIFVLIRPIKVLPYEANIADTHLRKILIKFN